jgi:hypothetical protein
MVAITTGRRMHFVHRAQRIAPKAMLQPAGERIGQSRAPTAGLGDRAKVVPDRIVALVPLHEKAFFAAFHVARQCAIGEAKAICLAHFVGDEYATKHSHFSARKSP